MNPQLLPTSVPPSEQPVDTLWHEQAQTRPPFSSSLPVPPQTPAEPHPAVSNQRGSEHAQPGKPRRLAELGAIAPLAAVLASTGTYVVTRAESAPSTAAAWAAKPVSHSLLTGREQVQHRAAVHAQSYDDCH